MKAGRDLDFLVAVRVMKELEANHIKTCDWCRRPDADRWNPHYGTFSSNINDAWEVVEKLSESHWFTLSYLNKRYSVSFGKLASVGTHFGWNEESDSLPEVICLAALKAVGYEVKNEM